MIGLSASQSLTLNELMALEKLVLKGTRLVIPKKLRKQILDPAHEGHQGIVKTKQRLRTKRPGVEELRSVSNDSEVLDRDRERKQKGKDCADNLRGACESNLKEGDKVLLQKPKSHKLSPSFEAAPYEVVVNKDGGQVEIKSPTGVHYKRNVTHLQKYKEDKSQETAGSNPK
ncbi:hypothetical protein AWC38_SpisGene19096 [Stylophora pistillata]|uniref:Uncharacterized protein n=1 Tax=Stylophora pistillata TaxID=50429 RepID=A0A2B4RHI3_STYPI|nr:hypothetical protein AWC38_SpisGene19096 [Stylophora pistillata]